jgi:hypothetical protein
MSRCAEASEDLNAVAAVTLRRVTLPPIDASLVRGKRWAAIKDPETAILVAEAWQAGHDAKEIAAALQMKMFAIRSAIAGMRMAGVQLRPSLPTYLKKAMAKAAPIVSRAKQREASHDRETAYFDLRQAETDPFRCAELLRLTAETMRDMERRWQSTGATDRSLPRFADHDSHVRDVLALGGFPLCRRPSAAA